VSLSAVELPGVLLHILARAAVPCARMVALVLLALSFETLLEGALALIVRSHCLASGRCGRCAPCCCSQANVALEQQTEVIQRRESLAQAEARFR
jgi:hypothetical protein